MMPDLSPEALALLRFISSHSIPDGHYDEHARQYHELSKTGIISIDWETDENDHDVFCFGINDELRNAYLAEHPEVDHE